MDLVVQGNKIMTTNKELLRAIERLEDKCTDRMNRIDADVEVIRKELVYVKAQQSGIIAKVTMITTFIVVTAGALIKKLF